MTIELQYLTPAGEVWRRSVITLDVLAEAMRLARLEDEEVDVTTVEHDSWGNTVMVEDEAADAVAMTGTFQERVQIELDILDGDLDFLNTDEELVNPGKIFWLADRLSSAAGALRKLAALAAKEQRHGHAEAGTHFGRVAGGGDRAGDLGGTAGGEQRPGTGG
jgi:hypothetical protein